MIRLIEIKKELIPYRLDLTIAEETWSFEIFYNSQFDYFTIDLYKNEQLILVGEKLMYSKVLFSTYAAIEKPRVLIIPYDLSEKENRITYENFNSSVFLYVFEESDLQEGEMIG